MSEVEVFEVLKCRIVVNEYGIHKYYNSADQLHRTNGPAVLCADGTELWYQNGLRHRTDGPAVLWADGTKLWYQNGLRHRTDGPAVEYASGDKVWYINGKRLTEAEFNQRAKLL